MINGENGKTDTRSISRDNRLSATEVGSKPGEDGSQEVDSLKWVGSGSGLDHNINLPCYPQTRQTV